MTKTRGFCEATPTVAFGSASCAHPNALNTCSVSLACLAHKVLHYRRRPGRDRDDIAEDPSKVATEQLGPWHRDNQLKEV